MLRSPQPEQYELEMVTLEQLVPQDHLLRKITATIDFEFIREEVRHLYCENNGRPAVDPVRLFKIMLLGYLFGIPSERKLVKEIEVNVAYRWFLGMGLTEKVIDASTLSQNRIRRFNGTDVFENVFYNILEQALAGGFIEGKVLYTDSTHLKADANKRKFINQHLPIRPSAYINELDQAVAEERKKKELKPLPPRNEDAVKSKDTKVSTTDPDAGFMHRDEKPKGFFYLDHRTVDSKHNFILDTYVTPGNVNDAQPYIQRLDHVCNQFDFKPDIAGLDSGYFQSTIAHFLEERGIDGVFGYRRPHKGPNTFQKRHFTYDLENDCYICPQGECLPFKTISREGYYQYHASRKACQQCSRKADCTQSKFKVITRHIWEDSKERANKRRLEPWAKKVYKRRNETVERSFADAKEHHGHRYARFRGRQKVQMQCLLAATAQNIKKLAMLAFLTPIFKYICLKLDQLNPDLSLVDNWVSLYAFNKQNA